MKQIQHNSVQEKRNPHSMIQEALADTVDVTRQTIIAIEKGNYTPSIALAINIAHTFDTHVESVFYLDSVYDILKCIFLCSDN